MKTSTLLRAGLIALVTLSPLAAEAKHAPGDTISGVASFYHDKFHGRTTANGERFDQTELTAAHKRLPFGTRVRVTDKKTGKSVVVRINDRGPYVKGRVIDLSRKAARKLGIVKRGLAKVKVEILSMPNRGI